MSIKSDALAVLVWGLALGLVINAIMLTIMRLQ